jgi:hypothetical protein
LNVAVTALLASILKVHVPVPAHAPVQPANTALPTTRALSVTTAPLSKALLQAVPQLMPAGLLVTVPFEASVPLLATLSVNLLVVALVIVNGKAVDADVPGFSAVTCALPAVAMSLAGIAADN